MLKIAKFTFNPFQENTYLITDTDNNCWIIDPGMSNSSEELELASYIEENALIPRKIINTHAHIDHILGIDFVAKKYKIPFFIHDYELPILNNAAITAKMFGFQFSGVATTAQGISEEETIKSGENDIEIILVPGHSPGSIALYSVKDKWIISGDALFKESIGRTDLPMGNHQQLIESIKTKLLVLPPDTIVYSGHGPSTTIKHEKKFNPFL